MRVTMLVRCLAMMRGGGETRHLAWARELTALGVDVDVITGAPIMGRPRHAVDEVRATIIRSPYMRDFVYRFQNRRGFGRLTMTALHVDEEWFCRAAWKRIAGGRAPDVVHAHALHQAARLRVGGIPVVINLPGAPNPRYHDDLRLADAVIADGWAAEHLPRTLGRPVERVNKGVDVERFRPDGPNHRAELGLRDRRVVVTVARLVPLKHLSLLLDAIAILRQRTPGVRLLIVGGGPEAGVLAQHAAALGIADCVTFAGHVPHADAPSWFRSGDVFALSSSFDNSPNAVLEAMACALPIVTTDVGGVREFVTERVAGALVGSREPAAFAGALERYLADPAEAKAAGARNRARAIAEFSWRASALRLLEVYDQVVGARRRTVRASA